MASHNQWSGGEYLNNTNGLQVFNNQPIIMTVNKDYSSNGDSSFKIESTGKLWGFMDIVFADFTIGEQIQVTMDILPLQSSCLLSIYAYGINQDIMQSVVNIPQNNIFSKYSITSNSIPEGTTDVRIRILQNTDNPSILFLDNIHITKI